MTTRIKIELDASGRGIDNAIAQLRAYPASKLDPAADELAKLVAESLFERMAWRAHVRTGDLKANINGRNMRRMWMKTYRLTIDPVHAGETFHYAAVEQAKGGEHDFTKDNKKYGKAMAPVVWRGSIKAKL